VEGAQLGVDKSKLGKTCIAGPGRRSPGIFRLFAIDELIGDKPLARSSHSIFPICGVVRVCERLDDWSILSRSGRAPGGGSCGGSSYQDIRTRRMNGKNLNHERRSLEHIVVVSYLLTPPHTPNAKMEGDGDGDARSESPASDLPVASGKGLGECSCVPVSPVLNRT
jgi:hypothetical protein